MEIFLSVAVLVISCLFGENICDGTVDDAVAHNGWNRVNLTDSESSSGKALSNNKS